MITLNASSCDFLETVEFISIYEGVWAGTYTGPDDSGTWIMKVDSKGEISGAISSELFGINYDITGHVENSGELYMSNGETSSGATFRGYINGDTTNGTWENSAVNITGVWDGTRKSNSE